MTIVTKGMGVILKSIKGLKKSKKFPGAGAEPKIIKQWKKRKEKGRKVTSEDIATDPRMERIHRTRSRRDRTASKLRGFRKDKGRLRKSTKMGFGKEDHVIYHPKTPKTKSEFIKTLKE